MTTLSLDIPGLIRRVRREADLSQRDLAALLGIDQSVVARWETGASAPSLLLFGRLLTLGGLRLAVVVEGAIDESSPAESADEAPQPHEAEPMRQDAVRDRQRRRFPSHLDVHDRAVLVGGEHRPRAPWRRGRDRIRAATGMVPRDHPSWAELRRARADGVRRRLAARVAMVRSVPGWRSHVDPGDVACTCLTQCWLQSECCPECACACEVRQRATLVHL